MRERLRNILGRAVARAADAGRNDRLGALAAVVALAVLVVADVILGQEVSLIGTFVIVPFIAAVWAGVGTTALVALVTLAAGALSGLWNMNFGDAQYDARTVVLIVGGLLAMGTAWARERARGGERRLELLDEVGRIADGSLPLGETLERVIEVIVPEFADACMVDAIHDQRVLRSAVRVRGRGLPADRELERWFAARKPSLPAWMGKPDAPFPRHPRFIPRFNDEDARRLAHDAADLERVRALGTESTITVAMVARDRLLGALTVLTAWSGRRYALEDVRFAQVLAGRVALALDNAGLFSDLESVERRMDNVMSILDEAVMIHDAQGELVYANPAADRMMGFEPGGALGPAEPAAKAIRERLVIRDEGGQPLAPEELAGARALEGTETEPVVLRVSPREGGPERWLISRAKPILGPEAKALYSVTAIEDVTAVKSAEFAQRLLARAGEALATSADPEEMLNRLVAEMTPEFCEWAAALSPAQAATLPELAEAMEAGAASLLGDPGPVIAGVDAEVGERARSLPVASLIAAPLQAGGNRLGVLLFGNGAEGRRFDEGDLALAVDVARRTAEALEIARLGSDRAEVARVLQEGLKPPPLPHMPGWDSAAIYLPAGEVNAVGGDFYEAFEVDGGWMVIVGDVVGRGAAAASLTALARHTIRTAGRLTGDPVRALELLDAALRARGDTALCTCAIGVLPDSGDEPAAMTFVSAGHPLPLRIRDGVVEELGTPGPLLGAFEGASWATEEIELEIGDQLVLFTDGVVEARGAADRFGDDRLRAELAAAEGPLGAIRRVTNALTGFIGDEPEDDVAVVVVQRERVRRFEPNAPARASVTGG